MNPVPDQCRYCARLRTEKAKLCQTIRDITDATICGDPHCMDELSKRNWGGFTKSYIISSRNVHLADMSRKSSIGSRPCEVRK